MIILTAVKAELIGLAEGSLEDITNTQFMRLLTRAIENRYEEVVSICDEEYVKEVTLSSPGGYNIPLPDNFYRRSDKRLWNLYEDSRFVTMLAGRNALFSIKGSSLRFDSNTSVGEEFHLQYSITPTRYTKMSETFIEEGAMELLLSEMQSLYYGAIDENEPNASYANSLNQANRLGI